MRCPIRQNAPVIQEWLWRGGRLRTSVTGGVFFGIFMGAFFYWWASPSPPEATARAMGAAAAGGVASGALLGILMAVLPSTGGWWRIEQLSVLPPSDRVAVLRAVRGGEPVCDPRLAPGVLAYAEAVMASIRKQQPRRRLWFWFAAALFQVINGVGYAVDGRAWQAVFSWAIAVSSPPGGCRGNSSSSARGHRQQRISRPARSAGDHCRDLRLPGAGDGNRMATRPIISSRSASRAPSARICPVCGRASSSRAARTASIAALLPARSASPSRYGDQREQSETRPA